jgi:voltage-gated potassium channel
MFLQEHKKRAYEILENVNPDDRTAKAASIFLTALILANAAAVILESIDLVYDHHRLFFRWFGSLSIAIFVGEYILRLWSSNADEKYRNPVWGRIRFALTPLMIIDLMVILPYYLPLIFPDLRFLRAARIFWTFRLLKIGRYSESLRSLENAIRSQKEELLLSFAAIFFFSWSQQHSLLPGARRPARGFPNIQRRCGGDTHNDHNWPRSLPNHARGQVHRRPDNYPWSGDVCAAYRDSNLWARGRDTEEKRGETKSR